MHWDDCQIDREEALSLAFPDVAFVIDENGRHLDVIAGERSRGLLYEDTVTRVDKTLHEVLPEDDADEYLSIIRTAIETGQTRSHEYRLDVQKGERWFEARVEPLPRQVDGADAVVWVSRDITDRKRYETQLEATTEKLEALNRVVRHDIRNDMSIVLGWAELLDDHVDDPGREYLRKILASGERVVELTDTARDYVEALTAENEIPVRSMALRPLLETEIDLRQESFPTAEFVIRGDVPDVEVTANRMLGSVFRNLLTNAVQHNDADEPVVELTCDVHDDDVVVRIADDGPGIPDDQKDTIFGKGEAGLDSPGTGIGLYLVRTLVSQYGGSVRVADNDPTGAVFAVRLPRVGQETGRDS